VALLYDSYLAAGGEKSRRLVFLNKVAWGTGGLVMFWVNQKYWQESGVPLAYFGVLLAGYGLISGLAGRAAPLARTRYGRRPLLAAVGVLPIAAYFAMASFLGWTGILLGILAPVGRGLGEVLFLEALDERTPPSVSWAPSWAMGSTAGDSRPSCRRSESCSRSPS
jgi:hypothetical protein